MNHYNYKNSYAWPQAIELITAVNHLSDDLPSTEQTTLANELRRTVIDLATAVAVDLLAGTPARIEFAVRLETQLEVIRQVYPALDTAVVDKSLESLMERLQSDKFAEQRPVASSSAAKTVTDLDDDSAAGDQPESIPEPPASEIITLPPVSTTIPVQSEAPTS